MNRQRHRRLSRMRSGSQFENNLIDRVLAGKVSRRNFIQTATLTGMSVPLMAAVLEACGTSSATTSSTGTPSVNVNWAVLPYWDTCTACIGTAQGWFKDVGITLNPPPNGTALNSADDATAVYASGREDVMQYPGSGLMPAAKTIPPFKMFTLTNLFQGWAVVGQPNKGFVTYSDLVKKGVSSDEAFRQSISQLKGKRYAYPTETNTRQFQDLVFKRGGITINDFTSLVNPDAENVALMLSGRADFQTGGGPSRLTLESHGFVVIVSSADLAAAAQPSADSPELQAVLHDGMTASDQWVNANHETVLRLASVNFRINQQINDNPDKAASIHVPYINSIAGTQFTSADAKVAYFSLQKFYTFDQQQAIFKDDSNPLNIKYVTGSAIKLYEKQGLFKPGQYKVSDFVSAGSIYDEMVSLKAQAAQSIKDATAAIESASGDTKLKAEQTLAQAKLYQDWFDFLDSSRTAKAALSMAKGS